MNRTAKDSEELLRILFLEDIVLDAELIWREVSANNISFEKLHVSTMPEYLNGLDEFMPDIIVSDYSLPQFDGMSALKIRNEKAPLVPFILVTGHQNEEVAVECMKNGADDYILKENLSRLGPALINAMSRKRLLKSKVIADEALGLANARLKNAQVMSKVGNWELNLSDRAIWSSEEARRIYGFEDSDDTFNIEKIQSVALPEYRDILDEAMDRLLLYNEPYDVEFKLERENDGEIRTIHSKAELSISEDREKVTIIGVIQDITERKIIEEELLSAKEKAIESDKLKTAFLHNISHEIRTPLNAIVGFSTLLGEPYNDAETTKSYIEVIMQSSNHLLGIISDIVDISNIEAGLVKVTITEINLNAKLRTLSDIYFSKSAEKKLVFTSEYALDYADAFINTDSTKLIQVITNILNNSLKFTQSGFIKLKYTVKDRYLEFSVSDSGIGIPKEQQDKVFERFYQVQNTVTRVYEGTGLGLSISKAYVELLGGKMWLNSEQGIGTTFYFTIPFVKSYTEKAAEADRNMLGMTKTPEKKTILIAEDIDSNFKLLKYFLSGPGFEIIRAVNGREAVDKFQTNNNIDLILMDIKMPVMDGYAAIRLIREKDKEIPIIAQTAYADDKEKAMESGCTAFISKPFDKKGLFRVLSEFID